MSVLRRPSLFPGCGSTVAALALVFAGCARSDDRDSIGIAIDDAERARELPLLAMPAIVRKTRAQYTADAQSSADEQSEDDVRTTVDAYGRLGFFARSFDYRGSGGESSTAFVASYSATTQSVTLVDEPGHDTLVHELVHALQDQHFDLRRLDDTAMSTDEALAKRGLVEGDATIAEYRAVLWGRGADPTASIAEAITPRAAAEASDKYLRGSELPLFFASYAAFAYTYGAAYVSDRLGLYTGGWSYAGVNELFGASGPASTQEVLHPTTAPDPIVATGLTALPAAIGTDYSVELVDRMGEWYTYLLLFETVELPQLKKLTARWDGDQLVLLRKKDPASPGSKAGPSGIVWTSTWDTSLDALGIYEALVELHTGRRGTAPLLEGTASDGERVRIEQRGAQVCFVKNLEPAQMELLAAVALSTKEEKRLEIVRSYAATPLVHRGTVHGASSASGAPFRARGSSFP